MENIVQVKVDSVPQKSLACELLMEMRSLSQIQIANLLSESENNTICSDGTTKFGHHYSSFDVCVGEDCYIAGLREDEAGTAEGTLQMLEMIIKDLSDVSKRSESFNKIIFSLRNTMFDRHVVQKKFNKLLEDYRRGVLPKVVKNWGGGGMGLFR